MAVSTPTTRAASPTTASTTSAASAPLATRIAMRRSAACSSISLSSLSDRAPTLPKLAPAGNCVSSDSGEPREPNYGVTLVGLALYVAAVAGVLVLLHIQ